MKYEVTTQGVMLVRVIHDGVGSSKWQSEYIIKDGGRSYVSIISDELATGSVVLHKIVLKAILENVDLDSW